MLGVEASTSSIPPRQEQKQVPPKRRKKRFHDLKTFKIDCSSQLITSVNVVPFFTLFGDVRRVSIPRHKTGKKKGFFFVEYHEEPNNATALLNSTVISLTDDRKVGCRIFKGLSRKVKDRVKKPATVGISRNVLRSYQMIKGRKPEINRSGIPVPADLSDSDDEVEEESLESSVAESSVQKKRRRKRGKHKHYLVRQQEKNRSIIGEEVERDKRIPADVIRKLDLLEGRCGQVSQDSLERAENEVSCGTYQRIATMSENHDFGFSKKICDLAFSEQEEMEITELVRGIGDWKSTIRSFNIVSEYQEGRLESKPGDFVEVRSKYGIPRSKGQSYGLLAVHSFNVVSGIPGNLNDLIALQSFDEGLLTRRSFYVITENEEGMPIGDSTNLGVVRLFRLFSRKEGEPIDLVAMHSFHIIFRNKQVIREPSSGKQGEVRTLTVVSELEAEASALGGRRSIDMMSGNEGEGDWVPMPSREMFLEHKEDMREPSDLGEVGAFICPEKSRQFDQVEASPGPEDGSGSDCSDTSESPDSSDISSTDEESDISEDNEKLRASLRKYGLEPGILEKLHATGSLQLIFNFLPVPDQLRFGLISEFCSSIHDGLLAGIQSLDLGSCTGLNTSLLFPTDLVLEKLLTVMPNLQSLSLPRIESFSYFSANLIATYCKRISSLEFTGINLTNHGLLKIGMACKRLSRLSLSRCPINNRGLRRFLFHAKSLKYLSILSNCITDKAFKAPIPSLEVLELNWRSFMTRSVDTWPYMSEATGSRFAPRLRSFKVNLLDSKMLPPRISGVDGVENISSPLSWTNRQVTVQFFGFRDTIDVSCFPKYTLACTVKTYHYLQYPSILASSCTTLKFYSPAPYPKRFNQTWLGSVDVIWKKLEALILDDSIIFTSDEMKMLLNRPHCFPVLQRLSIPSFRRFVVDLDVKRFLEAFPLLTVVDFGISKASTKQKRHILEFLKSFPDSDNLIFN